MFNPKYKTIPTVGRTNRQDAHRFIWNRLVLGSIGAEIWSASVWTGLATYWLIHGKPQPMGIILTLMSGTYGIPIIIFWMVLGIFHLFVLGLQPTKLNVSIRKISSAIEAAAWTGIAKDLFDIHQIATIIFYLPILILLYISIMRRTYLTWDILR